MTSINTGIATAVVLVVSMEWPAEGPGGEHESSKKVYPGRGIPVEPYMEDPMAPPIEPGGSPLPATDIGATLRELRERSGVTLEYLSRTTKISVSTLRHIEQNDIDELPSRVFLRGFLTAYAHEVGLSGDDIVQRYFRQFEPVRETISPGETRRPSPSDDQVPEREGGEQTGDERAALRPLIPALIIIGLVAIGYYALFGRHRVTVTETATSPSDSIGATPTDTHRATLADRPETATAGLRDTDGAAAVDSEALRLEIRSQRACWVAATADGTRVAYRLLQPAEQVVAEFRNDVIIRVGDAAAVAISIGGRAGRTLGRAGEPVTVHITRQNYREFLDP
jgi:cytoskeletal protein RodZ